MMFRDPDAKDGKRCPRCRQVKSPRVGMSAGMIDEPHASLEDCIKHLAAEIENLKKTTKSK